MFAERIHIASVGWDVDRTVEPALRRRADRVFLLAHRPSDPETDVVDQPGAGGTEVEAVVDRLGSAGVETDVRSVDQGDVYAVLGLVTTLADRQADDDTVLVNVSTGSRLAAIGAALACMDDDTDATAYYPPVPGTPAATTARAERRRVDVVPEYPIASPSRDEVVVMALVAVRDTAMYTPKKNDLIDEALAIRNDVDRPVPFAERVVGSVHGRADDGRRAVEGFDDLDSAEKKGAYRTLRTRALAELEDRGYVSIDDERVGRGDAVTLTPTGEAALQAFRHKILDVVRVLDTADAPQWLTDGLDDGAERHR